MSTRVLSIISVLLYAALLRPISLEAQPDLGTQTKALDMIADFADRLCNSVPTEGTSQNLELSGQAKAELTGVLKAVSDLGIEGAAKYQKSTYQGVLQRDLASLLKNSANCRLEVWKDLKDRLLPSTSGSSRAPSGDDTPTRSRQTDPMPSPWLISTEGPDPSGALSTLRKVIAPKIADVRTPESKGPRQLALAFSIDGTHRVPSPGASATYRVSLRFSGLAEPACSSEVYHQERRFGATDVPFSSDDLQATAGEIAEAARQYVLSEGRSCY